MIGVICTCAPSFNKFLHERMPYTRTLTSHLRSRFLTTRRRLLTNSGEPSFGYERRDSDQDQGAQVPCQGQPTARQVVESRGYELNDGKSFHNIEVAASKCSAKEDSIQLRNEVHQEGETIHGTTQNDKRKWASSKTVEEFEIL